MNKLILVLALTSIPAFAFASGDAILATIGLQFLSTIIIFIILFSTKIKSIKSLILLLVYVTTCMLVWRYFNNLPYFPNANSFNTAIVIIPIITVGLSWILIARYLKKTLR